jgi:effector-binding domain-containing protein
VIDTPTVVQSGARQTAVVALVIRKADIQKVMGPAIQEVMAALAAQGIQPAGSIFSYHRRVDPEVYDFEVGVPVEKPVAPSGRVTMSRLPAKRVARTVYHGGYEALGGAWKDFMAWIDASGYAADGDFWEIYVAGPESGPDASKWRTELTRPIGEA